MTSYYTYSVVDQELVPYKVNKVWKTLDGV